MTNTERFLAKVCVGECEHLGSANGFTEGLNNGYEKGYAQGFSDAIKRAAELTRGDILKNGDDLCPRCKLNAFDAVERLEGRIFALKPKATEGK